MDFKDSKTYQNLLNAYYYELVSSSQYDLFSNQATKDSYIEISKIYNTFKTNELVHARMWLQRLNNGDFPTTAESLRISLENINSHMYNEYSLVAKEEGYDELASLFNGVANISINQEVILNTQLSNIETNQVFCKENEILWICQACGNIMNGLCAPEICPVCSFPQGYYKPYTCFD